MVHWGLDFAPLIGVLKRSSWIVPDEAVKSCYYCYISQRSGRSGSSAPSPHGTIKNYLRFNTAHTQIEVTRVHRYPRLHERYGWLLSPRRNPLPNVDIIIRKRSIMDHHPF